MENIVSKIFITALSILALPTIASAQTITENKGNLKALAWSIGVMALSILIIYIRVRHHKNKYK